eukprot:4023622-Pyramimonas_sp.AAC.1
MGGWLGGGGGCWTTGKEEDEQGSWGRRRRRMRRIEDRDEKLDGDDDRGGASRGVIEEAMRMIQDELEEDESRRVRGVRRGGRRGRGGE